MGVLAGGIKTGIAIVSQRRERALVLSSTLRGSLGFVQNLEVPFLLSTHGVTASVLTRQHRDAHFILGYC